MPAVGFRGHNEHISPFLTWSFGELTMNRNFEGLQEVKVEAALEELGRQRVPVVKDAVRERPRHPLGAA